MCISYPGCVGTMRIFCPGKWILRQPSNRLNWDKTHRDTYDVRFYRCFENEHTHIRLVSAKERGGTSTSPEQFTALVIWLDVGLHKVMSLCHVATYVLRTNQKRVHCFGWFIEASSSLLPTRPFGPIPYLHPCHQVLRSDWVCVCVCVCPHPSQGHNIRWWWLYQNRVLRYML